MKRRGITLANALAAVSAAVLATVSSPVAPAQAAPVTCDPSHYFFVGGTGDPSGIEYSKFWPGEGPQTTIVGYPAMLMQLSWQIGEVFLRQRIAGYELLCPGSKIEVRGYSQGAGIAGDVAETLGLPATLIADPLRPTDATGRGGVIGTSDPSVVPRVSGGMPWRANRTQSPLITEICLQGDGICDSAGLNDKDTVDTLVTGFGWVAKHTAYSAADVAGAVRGQDNLIANHEVHFVFGH